MNLDDEQFDEDLKALQRPRGRTKHCLSKKKNHSWAKESDQTCKKKDITGYARKKIRTENADSFAKYINKYLNDE